MWAIIAILFALPGLLLLVVASIVLLYRYAKTKNNRYLKYAAGIWSLPLLLVLGIAVLYLVNRPVTLSKERIIGQYEIDTNFYPGANADWQKAHYRFEITDKDEFILYEKLADGSERQHRNQIRWSEGPPYKWSIVITEDHHVIDRSPTLYRTMNSRKFYYVFESKKFGNMFFRKKEPS